MRFCLRALALTCLFVGCKPSSHPVPAPVPTPPAALSAAEVVPSSAPVAPIPEPLKPAIGLPLPPALTEAGHDLILEFETDGRSGYNPRPEWPQGASGTTVGIGYDCGYNSRKVILSDWHVLEEDDRTRLADTAGITGQKARAKVAQLQDILVQWQEALDVFDTVDVAREFGSARKAMPGFEDLRPNGQAALISLGFNRGWGMSGANRSEMRAIRDLVPDQDYSKMALQLRKMVRVWKGTSIEKGMTRRRLAEAKLMEMD